MNDEDRRKISLRRRLIAFGAVTVLVFLVLAARLAQFQFLG